MAEGKKGFVLYADLIDNIDHLTNEEKGILFNHLLEYVNDKNPVLKDRLILTAWKPIERQLKRDLEKWEKRAINSRENGRMGGRPKNPTKPSGLNENPDEPKEPVIVNDNVSVNVKDTVIVNKEVTEICNFAWSLFPKGIRPEKKEASKMKLWSDTIDKLIRIDNKDPTEIKAVITWAREDEFWKSNFLSIVKLRTKKDGIKYYDIFNENRKNGKQRTTTNTKTFSEFDPGSYNDFKVAGVSDAESNEGS